MTEKTNVKVKSFWLESKQWKVFTCQARNLSYKVYCLG